MGVGAVTTVGTVNGGEGEDEDSTTCDERSESRKGLG